jgi:hypothetical protein
VIRYSSMHEKALPDQPLQRRMGLFKASSSRPKSHRPTEDPQSTGNTQCDLLRPEEWLPLMPSATRLPAVEDRLSLLQSLAHRRRLGADESRDPRTPACSTQAQPRT